MKIAFYKGIRPGYQAIYSHGVRWWTHSIYSHCEIIFSDGMAASASFIDGGVRFKKIDFDPEHWDFIDISDSFESSARQWFEDNEGKAYDIIGNLRFILPFITDITDKAFCSGSIASALGLDEPWRYSPATLKLVVALLKV